MCKVCYSCDRGQGWYDRTCLDCCARLIVASRFSRERQETMFDVIAKVRNSPSREAILDKVKELK